MPKNTTKSKLSTLSSKKNHTKLRGVQKKKGVSSRSSKLSLRHRRIFSLKLHHAGGLALFLVGVIYATFLLFGQTPPDARSAATCTPDAKLVNPCRPWLGAAVGGYTTGGKTQFQFFNTRLNNPAVLTNPSASTVVNYKLDVPHVYHSPGQNLFNTSTKETLNDNEIYGSPSKPILVNWKPGGSSWGATANGNSDSSIITAAQEVKALGDRKIMLALWHEPENDNVNAEGLTITGKCKTPTGSNGSAAEYRAMWRRVHDIFVQQGVKNVLWVWNPMGYIGNDGVSGWACIEDAMYPGDDIVDWIMWDPYSSGGGQFYNSVSRFYTFLNNHSDASHNYKSKPWGLAEHGSNASSSEVIAYWQEGVTTIGTTWQENKFPNIKLYAVFDTSVNGGVNGGLRVGYDNQGAIDINEQTAYNAFAKNILEFKGEPTVVTPPPKSQKDIVPPAITLDSPSDGSEVQSKIEIKATATDNVKVSAVTLRVDDKFVHTDDTKPYSFTLDTAKYPNGEHNVVVRAWDPTGNMGEDTVKLRFRNGTKAPAGPVVAPSKPSTTTVTVATVSDSAKPAVLSGTLIASPTKPGNSIQVWVDGVLQPNNTVDAAWLTNGTHTVKITENDLSAIKLVSVQNPPVIAAINRVRANSVAYGLAAGAILAVAAVWVAKPYLLGLTSFKERQITARQRRVK